MATWMNRPVSSSVCLTKLTIISLPILNHRIYCFFWQKSTWNRSQFQLWLPIRWSVSVSVKCVVVEECAACSDAEARWVPAGLCTRTWVAASNLALTWSWGCPSISSSANRFTHASNLHLRIKSWLRPCWSAIPSWFPLLRNRQLSSRWCWKSKAILRISPSPLELLKLV